MNIRQITSDKRRFLPLLLMADEQESMIDRYLTHGEMFAMYTNDSTPVCIAVVTDECNGVCELKNIAVEPIHRRHGYGRQMIEWLCEHYGGRYHTMIVGTGDSRQTVLFYRSCGFSYSHTVPDFFTQNYDHPIIEDGKVLRDMIYFERRIGQRQSTDS